MVFSWLFRGFFVAPVLGKFYAYSPWNSLLSEIAAKQVWPVNCRAISLSAGVILNEARRPLCMLNPARHPCTRSPLSRGNFFDFPRLSMTLHGFPRLCLGVSDRIARRTAFLISTRPKSQDISATPCLKQRKKATCIKFLSVSRHLGP